MTNAWYPHYPGDYGRDTGHLSLAQHGAYRLLLDLYYATAAPLLGDVAALYRICRAFDDAERNAVDSILSEFFDLRTDGYHNSRADIELKKRAEFHEKLSNAARKRWDKPGISQASSQAIASPQPHPQPHPEPEPQEEKKHPAPSALAVSVNSISSPLEQQTREAAFRLFWEKWPRKQARGSARKAWAKVPIAEYPLLMTGLEKWIKSDQWARGIIPHPATWLNEARWQDEDIPEFGGSNGSESFAARNQRTSQEALARVRRNLDAMDDKVDKLLPESHRDGPRDSDVSGGPGGSDAPGARKWVS